jgi:hypothetical protein
MRQGRITARLLLLALAALGWSTGCGEAQSAELEVTYYYLPG